MYDVALRPLKDTLFNTVSRSAPRSVSPLHITAVALLAGLASCALACSGHRILSLFFWTSNRALDCLDGALARQRNQQTDLGGFLDLLGDFIVYALVPIACTLGNLWTRGTSIQQTASDLLVVALLESAFWINNFVLFYSAGLLEKMSAQGLRRETQELTTLTMRPALVEGFESGLFFTFMLAAPTYVGTLSWIMFAGVVFGTGQRVHWLVIGLSRCEKA